MERNTVILSGVLTIATISFVQATETQETSICGELCSNLNRPKFHQENIVEATAVNLNFGPKLLLKANLLGGYFGIPASGYIEALSFGIGIGNKQLGFIVITKGAEIFPSGYAGDYLFAGSFLPIYLYLTSGLHSGEKRSRPVFYMFVGKNILVPYGGMDYVCIGGGTKWTLWVISPALQVDWRRVWFGGGGSHNDFLSAGISIELGGWWAR